MSAVQRPLLEEGRAAFARREWSRAQSLFEQADAAGELGVTSLRELGSTYMMTGDLAKSQAVFERALELAEREADFVNLAKTAVMLFRAHADRGALAVGRGLLARAERAIENEPEGAAHGHLAVMQAFALQLRGKLAPALGLAEHAFALGQAAGDLELQSMALVRQGRILIRMGRVEEGLARLDEAMVGVYGDRIDPVISAVIYCTTIDACTDLGDYERAREWSDMATTWCERRELGGFPGICRVHRAELMRLRGDLDGAGKEAQGAHDLLTRFELFHGVGLALYEVGMVRLQEGDLEAAERAFHQAHELGATPQPGISLLRFAQGKAEAALASIRSALSSREDDALGRAKLLPAAVEIALGEGEVEEAGGYAKELSETASLYDTIGLRAAAAASSARVCLASGHLSGCLRAAQRAVQEWSQVGALLETARARMILADAYDAQDNPEQAALERGSAQRGIDRVATQAGVSTVPPPASLADARTLGADSVTNDSGEIEGLIDGKIEILGTIGHGGMGTVLEGRHRLTGRRVAVKVLHVDSPDHARNALRLLQEALATGRINHPNVVDVYDAGQHGMAPYLVMERLEGECLSARLRRETRLPIADAVEIVCQAAAGVHAAHEVGVIHRDLKPDNLFLALAPDGTTRVKVLDFGISKLSDVALSHTRTGAILGTPFYMSPEQVRASSDVDVRTDVYGLGVVLFELLTGEVPFRADNYAALINKIISEPFPSAVQRRPEIPAALDDVLRRATLREFEGRQATAAQLARELREAMAAD